MAKYEPLKPENPEEILEINKLINELLPLDYEANIGFDCDEETRALASQTEKLAPMHIVEPAYNYDGFWEIIQTTIDMVYPRDIKEKKTYCNVIMAELLIQTKISLSEFDDILAYVSQNQNIQKNIEICNLTSAFSDDGL
jgi:hypothetical protein